MIRDDGIAQTARRHSRSNLFIPCMIVFASGFCVMAIELVASRLVAGYIGNSLQTWTTVIGAILAGISLGNYYGGRLADRYDSKRLAAVLFLLSGIACLSIIPASRLFGSITSGWIESSPWPYLPPAAATWLPTVWETRVLVVIFGSFLLPGTILGMVSPTIAKWALDHGRATGQTVGAIYSWNTLGSIVGTFATGYALIPLFPVTTIVVIAGVGLLVIGLGFMPAVISSRSTLSVPKVYRKSEQLWRPGATGLLVPCLLVFTSGFAVMVIEIAASRLVSARIGQSLYTWTSVIGVILAGISIGNSIGGRLADEFESKSLIASLFLISSVCCLSVLVSERLVISAQSLWLGPNVSWGWRVFATVFAAYFMPALALGTISPTVAKWALDSGFATGRTVGTVYSWNVIGSIAGTFLTGFYLISAFYINRLIVGASLVLGLIALTFAILAGPLLNRMTTVVWTLFLIVFASFAVMPANRFEDTVLAVFPVDVASDAEEKGESRDDKLQKKQLDRLRLAAKIVGREGEINLYDQYDYSLDYEYYDETDYYTVEVSESRVDSNIQGDPQESHEIRQLVLDALIHGYIDLTDYKYLHYEYEHIYASLSRRLLDAHKQSGQDLRVLFMGGGSYTFPRFLSEYYPGIPCDVAEIDPRVTLAIRRAMGLNAACGKRFFIIGDEELKPKAKYNPAPAEGLLSKASAIRAAFAPPELTAQQRIRAAHHRVYAAGGLVSNDVEGADYLLDIRSDSSAAIDPVVNARKSGVKVIGDAEFQELLEQTSHPNIDTHHLDARQYMMRNRRDGEYDIIYGDAFNDFSVPAHLTTLEFNREMARLLKPDGIFMANVIDKWQSSKFMGAYLNTLKLIFGENVYLFMTSKKDPGNSRSTFVIVCSKSPVDVSGLGERDVDIHGSEVALMSGDPVLMNPVIRGGLRPHSTLSVTSDGKTTSYSLPGTPFSASVERVEKLKAPPPNVYEWVNQKEVVFDQPPARGQRLTAVIKNENSDLIGTEEIVGDGTTTKFATTLTGSSLSLYEAGSSEKLTDSFLRDDEYEVVGSSLSLKKPAAYGTVLKITTYTDQTIVLLDEYCPVDNQLADVIATRMKED